MTLHKGYIIAICAAVLAGLWDVYTRVAVDGFSANPPFYSAVSLLIAAIILIILAGPGKGGMQTLKSPYLWQNLSDYCEQDTYAMVLLLDVLRRYECKNNLKMVTQ